jgi:type IV secretion system protein VirB2
VTSKNLQNVLRTRAVVALGAAALIVLAGPALAQSIDLSPVQTLLQGIVDAITGPLGIVIGTLALIGVFLSWLFGILDFRQALWVVVAIAGIAERPPSSQPSGRPEKHPCPTSPACSSAFSGRPS